MNFNNRARVAFQKFIIKWRHAYNGTPAFFVSGKTVCGRQPFDSFMLVIDRELERLGVTLPEPVIHLPERQYVPPRMALSIDPRRIRRRVYHFWSHPPSFFLGSLPA
jgi:hypothetical protein